MALLLRREGVRRVRPLAGGWGGWRAGGYPTVQTGQIDDTLDRGNG